MGDRPETSTRGGRGAGGGGEFGELAIGTPVEVRLRFDYSWARGFEVAGVGRSGYQLRRKSDGAVLPAEFDFDDVRVERKRPHAWWA